MRITTTLLLIMIFARATAQDKSRMYSIDTALLLTPDTSHYSYFGKDVQDSYRFLENLEDSTIQHWYQAENQFARKMLGKIPKNGLLKKLEAYFVADSVRTSLPVQARNGLFYILTDKQNDVESLVYQPGLNSKPTTLYSTGDTKANDTLHRSIDYFIPSPSGELVILGISTQGSEQSTLRVLNVQTKQLLADTMSHAPYASPAWLSDESGFFFKQYQADYKSTGSQVWLHHVDQAENQLVFSFDHNPELPLKDIDLPYPVLFPGSNQLFVQVNRGSSHYLSLYSAPLNSILSSSTKVVWQQLIEHEDQVSDFVFSSGSLFVSSYKGASNGKILAFSSSENIGQAKVAVPEGSRIIENIHLASDKIYLNSRLEGRNQISTLSVGDYEEVFLKLPTEGSVEFPTARYSLSDTIFFKLESWNLPESIIAHISQQDSLVSTNLQTLSYPGIDSIAFKVIEVPSHDGEKVPMTIIYNKSMLKNGPLPTYLYAYGAYGFTYPPRISDYFYNWARNFGIVAIAHVRGSGYKGEDWYKAGHKSTKPNSWKDVIACAAYLIDQEYTSPGKLVASGSSAGGITMGRALVERPELFSAASLMVPVANPLRVDVLPTKGNTEEYGTVENPEGFEGLIAMDPYMNLKPDVEYPPVLFTASANDARVPMWQPGKMVARMQEYLKKQCTSTI